MKTVSLALLGFGNVGKALLQLLARKRQELADNHDIQYRLTGIMTGRHGGAIDLQGIDENAALTTELPLLSRLTPPTDSYEFIRRCGADVLFENSPVDYETGQPATDHLRLALETGMHAITANKGPVVHAYAELNALARARGRKFYFESTVMDGAPIFSLFREALPGAKLESFNGILNSTTNLILTRMEAGESFTDAVRYCQSIGIAETDPSGDVDGWDAAVKVAALATVLMGIPLKPQQVDRQGIRELTPDMLAQAARDGQRWKLVCSARRAGRHVEARVAPELVGSDSPLFTVMGTSSVVQFQTDTLSSLTIVEGSPGPQTTAYGLLADFINAVKTHS